MPEPWMCPLPPDKECPHANERDYLLEEIEFLRAELQSYKDFMDRANSGHPTSTRYKERTEFLERLNKIMNSESRSKQIKRTE